jgi:outer membrane lipoprotein-sorting protein
MKKSLIIVAALVLTACGNQAQTQPYNPYMYQQGSTQMGAYGANYQQNLYQQPSNYSYTNPAQGQQQYAGAVNPAMGNTVAGANSFASTTQQQAAPLTRSATTARTTTPATAAKTVTASKSTATRAAAPVVAPRPAAAPAMSMTQTILSKAKASFDKIQSYVATADVYETKAGKGPVKAKIKVWFQKPGTTKMHLVEHTNALFKDAKLTYKSGIDQITGRPGGAMSFMKMTLPMSDDKVTSRRNYRLDQVDTLAIVTRLIRPELNPKLLGKTTVNGRQVAVLEYQPQNHFDPTITKELLGIDMETYFVRIHEMYVGEELVYSLKLPEVQLNQPLTAKDFEV